MCPCKNTGFIGEIICIEHLHEAFDKAMADKDFELVAVIIKKRKEMLKAVHNG